MAAASTVKVAVAAACIALIALSMGPPAAMADVQDDCRASCLPKCDAQTTELCRSVVSSFPALNLLYTTCKVRLSSGCSFTCITACSANTLTPPSDTPSPPPCKQY